MDWLSGRKRKLEPQTVFSVLLDLSSSSVTWGQTGVLLLRSSGCSGGLFLPKAETLCFDLGIYRQRLRAKCVPVTAKVSKVSPLPFHRTTPLLKELAFRLHCYGKADRKAFSKDFGLAFKS